MPGPLPKENRQRERDTRRRDAEFQTFTDDGELRGPILLGAHEPATFAWYENYRRSPQAQRFEPTDWQRLLFLAPLVDRVALGIATVAERAELRLSESLLGGTYGDRLKHRIRISSGDGPSATVIPLRTDGATAIRDRMRRSTADEPVPF